MTEAEEAPTKDLRNPSTSTSLGPTIITTAKDALEQMPMLLKILPKPPLEESPRKIPRKYPIAPKVVML
jgi:hypothetical protein